MTTRLPARMASPQANLAQRRHVLDLDDFAPHEIDTVLDTAETMRGIMERDVKKVPSLRGKVVLTLFYEPSTRTRVSFEQAAKLLSADVINVTTSESSTRKGESLLNTALTLQAMQADTIVIRHPHAGAPYFLSRHLDRVRIINAGDGRHAHPTQALLDLFTLRRAFQEQGRSLQGAKVVMVGDLLHSRVARSNVWGLAHAGARVVLCGPPTLVPRDLLLRGASGMEGPVLSNIDVETNLDKALEGADAVMALRLQQERHGQGMIPSNREYTRRWLITPERFARARQGALLLHPGPLNEGIEISSALVHGGAAHIEEQVTNGVAVRMALLYLLLGNGHEEVLLR